MLKTSALVIASAALFVCCFIPSGGSPKGVAPSTFQEQRRHCLSAMESL